MLREVHIKTCPILNGHGVTTSWNLEQRVGIARKMWNKIISRQCLIYLRYTFNFFMNLPLNYTESCTRQFFENATPCSNARCRLVVNSASCLLQLPLAASDAVCCIPNAAEQCISRSNLHVVNHFFLSSPCTILDWA